MREFLSTMSVIGCVAVSAVRRCARELGGHSVRSDRIPRSISTISGASPTTPSHGGNGNRRYRRRRAPPVDISRQYSPVASPNLALLGRQGPSKQAVPTDRDGLGTAWVITRKFRRQFAIEESGSPDKREKARHQLPLASETPLHFEITPCDHPPNMGPLVFPWKLWAFTSSFSSDPCPIMKPKWLPFPETRDEHGERTAGTFRDPRRAKMRGR